ILNHTPAHQQRAVLDDAQVRKGIAPPRPNSAQRQQLGCTGNEDGIRQGSSIMPEPWQSCTLGSRTSIPACPIFQALAACPLNAGRNTSCTNVSNDVGVVFAAVLGSSAFM